jgi:hypothetical protein
MAIPEKIFRNQSDRTSANPEACGLYTMRRAFQWLRGKTLVTQQNWTAGDRMVSVENVRNLRQ